MSSKTEMLRLVRHLQWDRIVRAIREDPAILGFRDADGRSWLHRCCGIHIASRGLGAADSIRTADVLLDAGLDVNEAAAEEGTWRATPLWFAIARGDNVPLARHLLRRGSEPDHCLWAAVNQNNPSAIRLLLDAGAVDPTNADASLLLAAVDWNKLEATKELLRSGADPNYVGPHGVTPLLLALKRRRDVSFASALVEHGASGDLADAEGRTALGLLRRKRDPAFRALRGELEAGETA